MNPDRWQRVHELFHEAVELPDKARPSFLDHACGDGEIRRHVEDLLRGDIAKATLLDMSVQDMAALLTDDDPEPEVADQIGPYRLLDEIGRGGMGAVYHAERADGQFDRRVALKLIKRGMDTDEILRRFRHERQILAGLEHPNIARLYDGGVSADGRPYLVMEYVDGQPIDEYCDKKGLDINQRLELFRDVCAAVQFAHQNLVVHRDLKPSNILVAADGRVKLLDFGIAKLLSDESGDLSSQATRTGIRILTPSYAAPEQLKGNAVTTAIDVYSLGVVLYVLMTGSRPFDSTEEVLSREALRPSAAVNDERRRRLRGDLDTIILKALRKEPERRFTSVAALRDDIEHHLAGLPVAARPATVGYRARTFIKRNKTMVGAALLVFAALIGGLSAAVWQAQKAAHERDVALQVSSFLEMLFRSPSPSLEVSERLDTMRVGDVLRFGALQVRQDLEGQPELQSEMMLILGKTLTEVALYDEARPLLEDALELLTELQGRRDTDVADAVEALGVLEHREGSYTAAESLHTAVLALRIDLLGEDHPSTGLSHNYLASALEHNSRYDEALPHYLRAYEIARRNRSTDPGFFADVANNLGQIYFMLDDAESAEPHFRESVETLRNQPNPRHPKLALSLNNLAIVLQYSDEREEAERMFEESLSIYREIYGEAHPDVSLMLQNLAILHGEVGNYALEDSLYRIALEIDRQVYGSDHPGTGLTMRNLALNRLQVGAYDEAETLLREALEIFDATLPDDHLYRGIATVALGRVLTQVGQLEEAGKLLTTGDDILSGQLPADHWLVGVAQRDLGMWYLESDELEKAEAHLTTAHPSLAGRGGDAFRELLLSLVELYEALDQPEKVQAYQAQLVGL